MDMQAPSGRFYLPRDAFKRRSTEARLLDTFARWGYREIIPPILVPPEVGYRGRASSTTWKPFALLNRHGDVMTLRSDLTESVAFLAATCLDVCDGPARLYYAGSVFRSQEPGSGKQEESCQAGVELIGAGGEAADLEILALAAECLLDAGLSQFRIGVGDARLLGAVLSAAGAPDEAARRIRSALARRDYVALEAAVSGSGLADDAKALLRRLPDARGGREVLRGFEGGPVAGNPAVREAAGRLASLHEALSRYGLGDRFYVDLAIMREFDYYTGIVFEGYAMGSACAVIGGGRYDLLLGAFGKDRPACGFAVDVDLLGAALFGDNGEGLGAGAPDCVVVSRRGAPPYRMLEEARAERAAGHSAELCPEPEDLGAALARAAARGVRHAVIVSEGAVERRALGS